MHGGRDRQENIIHGVFAEINTRVSYSVAAAESFASAKAALVGSTRDGFPIENFEFVKAGTGVCRHMALATGALLEMAADLGLLKGAAAYHRSHVVANDNPTGHAWTRFTDQAGNRWVLDVANRYCGLIENAPGLAWDYHLDGEARNSVPREYLLLGHRPDGRERVGVSVRTRDRVFDTAGLNPVNQSTHESYCVETVSGNRYLVGWDTTFNRPVVLNEREMFKGPLARQYPVADMPLRVGDPIHFTDMHGENRSTPIKRIVAIGAKGIEDHSTSRDQAVRDAKAYSSTLRFLVSAQAAMAGTTVALGKARNGAHGFDQRLAHHHNTPGFQVNLDEAFNHGDVARAWLETASGNTYQIQRAGGGEGFEVVSVRDSKSHKARFGFQLARLGEMRIGEPFQLGEGSHTSRIVAASFEPMRLFSREEVARLSGGVRSTSIANAEKVIYQATAAQRASAERGAAPPDLGSTSSLGL